MKKIRSVLVIVFIFSLSMILIQIKDKKKSQAINADLSNLYYGGKSVPEPIGNLSEVKDKKTSDDKDSNKAENEDTKDIGEEKDGTELGKKEIKVLEELAPIVEKNKDTVGWLKIDNTTIDYPLVQGEDNDFYLNHDFYRKRNSQGSIFMDHRNRPDFSDKHTIIYGHHIKNRTMFNDLNLFKDEEFFNNNKTFTLRSLEDEFTYEIFSTHVYENDPYIIKTRFNNDEFEEFLEKIEKSAEHNSDITLKDDEKILTLITCAYDFKDARYVVHARRVK